MTSFCEKCENLEYQYDILQSKSTWKKWCIKEGITPCECEPEPKPEPKPEPEDEVNKWCADFASNYPRTQTYVKDIMVDEIELWNPELIMFVLVQATNIAIGFKAGRYDPRLKKNIDSKTREMFIDAFTCNYLKNATDNINKLWCACGDWDRVLNSVLSVEALKADCFVDRAISKYGDDKKERKINVVITAPKDIQHIAEGLKRVLKK